jgi:hypothetical protein
MRRFVLAAALTCGLAASGAVAAPRKTPAAAPQSALQQGLQALVAAALGDAKPRSSSNANGQGANHASEVAIMKVCSHDNPSSQRAAICPRPVSPD